MENRQHNLRISECPNRMEGFHPKGIRAAITLYQSPSQGTPAGNVGGAFFEYLNEILTKGKIFLEISYIFRDAEQQTHGIVASRVSSLSKIFQPPPELPPDNFPRNFTLDPLPSSFPHVRLHDVCIVSQRGSLGQRDPAQPTHLLGIPKVIPLGTRILRKVPLLTPAWDYQGTDGSKRRDFESTRDLIGKERTVHILGSIDVCYCWHSHNKSINQCGELSTISQGSNNY